jgi:predicted phosphodiesterase
MRYAVISDIHGNLEAFQSVLEAISKDKVDKYLFLGDVVGYGADPSTCIRLLKSLNPAVAIAGNHEWGVLNQMDISYFNDAARAAVVWNRDTLDTTDVQYIKSFELIHEGKDFAMVHGSLSSPEEFNYILNDYDAYHNMKAMKAPICFVGHSHVAGIYYSGARVRFATDKISIEPNKKYVVNAGSVGQPRDSNPLAAYVIYDDKEATIEVRRVAYDIKKAQDKILQAGLPPILAYRLAQGR